MASNESTLANNEEGEAATLARLAAQFGDMDLSHLVTTTPKDGDCASSEESSLAEPTPEELRAWQEAQFKKGEDKAYEKKKLTLTPLQRKREEKKKQREAAASEEDDWEEVYPPPELNGQKSVFFPSSGKDGVEFLGENPMLQQLANGDPEVLGSTWRRLYSSGGGDGLSFHNLLKSIKGYAGPTVMIIGAVPSAAHFLTESTDAAPPMSTFGVYTATPWTESTEFFGSSDCFLFSINNNDSTVKILRPKAAFQKDGNDDTRKYMYCNQSSSNRGQSASSSTKGYGIGVGGTPSQPRLHLTESLEECRALSFCSLFESGDLFSNNGADSLYYFDVDALEVWGVGGEDWIQDALLERQKQDDMDTANLIKARTVDKKQFLDDFRAGLAGGSSLFAHASDVSGRTGV